MHIKEKTLDDLMHEVFERLISQGTKVSSSKGNNRELGGVLLELTNPRARLSRTEVKGTLFSCLGEFLWYLSGSNQLSFIKNYLSKYGKFSDDGRTTYGAYGPRLFNMRGGYDQVANIISLLKKKPSTRQAVIQIFDARDLLKPHKDLPCTCTIQFMLRDSKLDVFATMRSNDVFLGFPHDVFAFTMLQEVIARSIKKDIGTYKHSVGSLHVYDKDLPKIGKYLKEGWQETIAMPPIPKGDPWKSVKKVLDAEHEIRNLRNVDISSLKLNRYWSDLVRLLQIYSFTKNMEQNTKFADIENSMTVNTYKPYINKIKKKIGQK